MLDILIYDGMGAQFSVMSQIKFKIEFEIKGENVGLISTRVVLNRLGLAPQRALIGGAQPNRGWWAPVAQRI